MKLSQLVKDFDKDTLDWWDGADWRQFVFKGVFQVYDRFITERTFGVEKRIFLSSTQVLPEHVIVRTPDGKVCLLEAATPDYEYDRAFRNSLLLRETNAIVKVELTVEQTNAIGVATGKSTTGTLETWGNIARYNSNQSSEFPGVLHETDILVVDPSFPVTLDSRLTVNDIAYKVAEIGRVLRLKELRVRRMD